MKSKQALAIASRFSRAKRLAKSPLFCEDKEHQMPHIAFVRLKALRFPNRKIVVVLRVHI